MFVSPSLQAAAAEQLLPTCALDLLILSAAQITTVAHLLVLERASRPLHALEPQFQATAQAQATYSAVSQELPPVFMV